VPLHAAPWLAHHPRLDPSEIASIDQDYRQRVRSVQSVDRMLGDLEQTLRRTGQASNTVIVFSSDNGLHMGQYSLNPGKLTAFDTDVNVPLVMTGPNIPRGVSDPAIVQNTDLAPTFEQLGGASIPSAVDGHSIVALLHGEHVPWRQTALVEHHGPVVSRADPDYQSYYAGDPPSYAAMRTATFTYVQYIDGEREYYDRTRDPNEIDNTYWTLSSARKVQLENEIRGLQNCHGATSCWRAAGTTTPGA
jgi:arylsulfatase A-like enzyme